MKWNSFRFWLCLVLAGIVCFSGYQIVTILLDYKAGEDTYEDLQQYVHIADPTKPAVDPIPTTCPNDETRSERKRK